MFSGWGGAGFSGTIASAPEQSPSHIKPYDGPLIFPTYSLSRATSDPKFTPPADERSFYSFFAKLRRITDVSSKHLEVLNLRVEYNFPVAEMLAHVPKDGGWFPDAATNPVWAERARELSIDNLTATNVLLRVRRDLKLGHMYKFFQSVEMMRVYYKLSKPGREVDQGTEIKNEKNSETETETETEGEEDAEGTKESMISQPHPLQVTTLPVINRKRAASEEALGAEKKGRPSPPVVSVGGAATTSATDPDLAAGVEEPVDDGSTVSKHFAMPESFREDIVRNFVEALCYGYGVKILSVVPPYQAEVQQSRFPVAISHAAYQMVTSIAGGRRCVLEGPLLGLHVRNEHTFRSLANPVEANRKRQQRLMAFLAITAKPVSDGLKKWDKEKSDAERAKRQQLARSICGKTKHSPTGGPPPEEIELDLDLGNEGLLYQSEDGVPQDVIGIAREVAAMIAMAQKRIVEKLDDPLIKCRILNKAIGKEPDSYWDDIFLVTTIHHHVSISHLRVSTPYLRFLATGKLPRADHPFIIANPDWDRLVLQKSEYRSLLIPEERIQIANELCGVLQWITRNIELPVPR